jgi:cysteine synthase A
MYDGMRQRPLPDGAARRFAGIRALIGDTPMLAVRVRFRGRERVIYAKAEYLNFTGSIKDRMAVHILEEAVRTGRLKPGDTICEATSGNAGIAFCAIGRALGHPVSIYMPDWMSEERKALIRSLGAEINLVSKADGGFLGSIRMTQERAAGCGRTFLPEQFANAANVEAHRTTTGPEILAQLASIGLKPDAFVAGVGTGGTVMGVGAYLRAKLRDVRIHPLEPAESPTLSTGCKVGHHRIQGVSDEFIPAIVDLSALDAVVAVPDGDSILMAQKLAASVGLSVGISSGANLLGALMLQEELGPDAVVATIFCDDNKKYLTTDLLREEPVKPGYLAPEIDVLGFDALPRMSLLAALEDSFTASGL